MPKAFRYRAPRTLGLDEIRDVLERCASLTGFRGFDPEEPHLAYFERESLPSFGVPNRGVQVDTIVVQGRLQGETMLDDFKEVFRRGVSTVGSFGTLRVWVRFQERDSRHGKRNADSAGIWVIKGTPHFTYYANGSRVVKDPAHRRAFMRQLAESALLPIVFLDEGDAFRIEHTEGGELWTSGGSLFGRNPSEIRVATPDRSAAEMVEVLGRFLKSFGSGRRFEHGWRAGPVFDGRPPHEIQEGPRILDAVVESGLPAASYCVQVGFRLSAIGGIESLRPTCGPGDDVHLTLASFEHPPKNRTSLAVITTADGHQVELESRRPVEVGELGERFGLQLSRAG